MLNSIIEDLQFISTIPKGAKPNFYDKTFISNNEWFTTIRRRWKGEKGEKGVIYMENLIDNIKNNYKNFDADSLKKLKIYLTRANIGINNIVYTYKMDEQIQVSDDYKKCYRYIEDLIFRIDSKGFFSHCPTIVRSFNRLE